MVQLFGENEDEVNPAIPAMSAMLATLAGAVAQLDSAQQEAITPEKFLDLLDEVFNAPLIPFPTLLIEQEEKLTACRAMFRQLVEQSKNEFRMLNALAEVVDDDAPALPRPADVVTEGATGRAVLVLTASISNTLDRMFSLSVVGVPIPSTKVAFITILEEQLQSGIQQHGTRQQETDWLLEILEDLRR